MTPDDLPDAQRCDLPACEREAVEPTTPGPNACPEHHPDRDADGRDERESETEDVVDALEGVDDSPPEREDTPAPGACDDPGDTGENRAPEGGFPDETPTPDADTSASSLPGSSEGDTDGGINQQEGGDDGGVLVKATPEDAVYPVGEHWGDADFTAPEDAPLPDALDAREQWMCRHQGEKKPFAPWTDPGAPVECNHNEHDGPTTCDECDHDARWKWGDDTNYRDGETAAEAADIHPDLAGRVFLQQDPDPFAFVDGDDVRDPDTGEVHPAFRALLEHLGASYADISTSGTGVHVYYHAPEGLPLDGKGEADFQIDTEPWGANDDPPTVEIYANRHVCVTTAEHVPNTPIEVCDWDADALRAVLEAHGYDDKDTVSHDTDRDAPLLDDHDPDATGADETATDVRDIVAAVDDLSPHDLPIRSRQVGTDSTGWELWDPSTYRQSSGGDSLHTADRETFYDHKKGETFGVLKLFALERGILSKPSDRLAGQDWWDAVEAARDAGAPIPEYESGPPQDREPVAVLPPAVRDLSTATTGWDWKHAGRHGADDTTTDLMQEARDRTTAEIADAFDSQDRALVEALPTLGKTYGTVKAAAETGEPVTILTGRGNVEQYAQLKEWCTEFDLKYYTLPAFTRDCPTANGDHGEDWKDTVRDWYDRGATPQEIHAHAEYHLGKPLPCQAHEHQECPYSSAWRFEPDDYDVLIGHYLHAYNQSEKVGMGRSVVIDEFSGDAFERALGGPILKGAVTYYLQTEPGIPFDDYTELLEHRDDDERRAEALATLTDGELDTDSESVFQDSAAHADAPLAVFTILAASADDLGNGLERAPFPNDDPRVGVYDRAGVFSFTGDGTGDVRVLDPPPLNYTRSLVALDGTPTKDMWELSLGTRLNHRQVLSEPERRDYIRDGLNLNVVRTTEYVKPYNSPEHVNPDHDAALLEAVRGRHDEKPGLITTRTALNEYDDAGVLAFDADDGVVRDGPVSRAKWRGDVLGSNQFADTRLGVVTGSNHFGDGYIKKWGAYHGRAVERNDEKGADLSYGRFGDRVLAHMQEHDTLQAVMRFGRDGNGAVVYCHTNTLPEWLPLAGEGRVLSTRSDGERQVLAAVEDLDEWRTPEIAAHPDVDIGERQVFNVLADLAGDGVLTREWDGRGYSWTDDGLDELNDHGEVDLSGVEDTPVAPDDASPETVAEMARNTLYTWGFCNHDDEPDSGAVAGGSNGGDTPGTGSRGAGPPPDTAD